MLREISKKAHWKIEKFQYSILEKHYAKKSKYNFSDNIIISGSGRSGTTWIGEVLSSHNKSVLVNEPLKNSNSYKVQKLGFTGWGQHIPESANWPEAQIFFEKLFTGQELNPNYFTANKPKRDTNLWVHKFIRAQYLLPWLVSNFDTKTPIHILREPYAVIASQLQHGGFGKNRIFDATKHNKTPLFEHYSEFYDQWDPIFAQIKNYIQVLALHWALQNKYLLDHSNCHTKWKIIKYEDFLRHPETMLEKLSNLWGVDFSHIKPETLRKGSYSMINEVPENPEKQFKKWKNHLTEQDILNIDFALDLVGMKNIDDSKFL